ncbi:MAG: LON peptidase substrate-binding domain-containing protein [Acidimicrobiales bacterium]
MTEPAGPTPMFPLGTVLLPHNALPLHVFEPRYRTMIDRVVAGDGRFGVVLIERGSEVGGADVRTDVGCLAEIRELQAFDDGRYALIAVGVERIRILRWLPDDPFPRAETEPWEHPPPGADEQAAADVMARLRRALALKAEIGEPSAPATVELDAPPDVMIDVAASLAPIGALDKQTLLQCHHRAGRAQQLLTLLDDEIEVLEARIQMR